MCEETFGEFYDVVSGDVLDGGFIKMAREAEMETFGEGKVYKNVPLEECWKATGKAPL